MSQHVLLRLLDTFFRRWWLYLVPVVLLAGVGVASVAGAADSFRSVGTLNVEGDTVLGELTDLRGDSGFGYDTPAAATSKRLNALLQTDTFMDNVVTEAGLTEAVENGQLTVDMLRGSVTSYADGQNLIKVDARHPLPEVAQRVSSATITSFVAWVTDTEISESQAAEDFFADLLPKYRTDLDAARSALSTFLVQNPAPGVNVPRPDEQVNEIQRLNDDVDQASSRYNETLAKGESARLTTEQTKSDIAQRLRVIDEPQLPQFPQPKLKTQVMGLAAFLVLGFLFSAGAVVVGTVLDHGLRFPADVKSRLGMRALAVVPEVKLGRALARHTSTPPAPSPIGSWRPGTRRGRRSPPSRRPAPRSNRAAASTSTGATRTIVPAAGVEAPGPA